MDTLGIGLLGFGTVGSGMLRVLRENASAIEARLGVRLEIERVLVRDAKKKRAIEFAADRITEDVDEVIDDPKVAIVVELVGGVDEAFDYVMRAMAKGKHVVTANKALLATRGKEVFDAASEHGVDVFYEGAVCGGIPIIRAMRESFASERIQSIVGIMNGTSNFILSEMANEGMSFDAALRDAQEKGFAEADPSADVDGRDAAQKLAILASLGFGARMIEDDVRASGIRDVSPEDIEFAREHGYQIKPLAIAERASRDGKDLVSLRVHPAWVSNESPLAHVNGAYNAVLIRSEALGDSLLSGQGAGQMPTGSAVAADVIELARNIRAGATGRVPHLSTREEALSALEVLDARLVETPFYLRFTVRDAPGVLGRVASQLGEKGISLRIVRQEEGDPASICAITHAVRHGHVVDAVRAIDALDASLGPTHVLPIYE